MAQKCAAVQKNDITALIPQSGPSDAYLYRDYIIS